VLLGWAVTSRLILPRLNGTFWYLYRNSHLRTRHRIRKEIRRVRAKQDFAMSRLVDRIYECAFVPDLWPEILWELAQLGGALAGWLCISNGNVLRWSASSEEARAIYGP